MCDPARLDALRAASGAQAPALAQEAEGTVAQLRMQRQKGQRPAGTRVPSSRWVPGAAGPDLGGPRLGVPGVAAGSTGGMPSSVPPPVLPVQSGRPFKCRPALPLGEAQASAADVLEMRDALSRSAVCHAR